MTGLTAPSRILLGKPGISISDLDESTFFTSLHQSNGTTRMTSSGRLDELNSAIDSCLTADGRIDLLDIGISSGVSSAEWLDAVCASGRSASLTAADHFVFARLYRLGPLELLAERGGYVLLIHDGRRGYSHPVSRTGTWNNRFAHGAFDVAGGIARFGEFLHAGTEVRLISRRLQDRKGVEIVEQDIFRPAPQWHARFHAVRIANVLNPSYFGEARVRDGLANAIRWVREEGLFAICRTESNGCNHGTVFRRSKGRLRIEARVGKGSEVELLVPSLVT